MKYCIVFLILIGTLFCATPERTNRGDWDFKTYIIPKGTTLIYSNGTIRTTPWNSFLLEYGYGINLRKDAELSDNIPLLKEKIRNRDELIKILNEKVTNRQMLTKNLLLINEYQVDFMKTTHDIFGNPMELAKEKSTSFAKGFLVGAGITVILTLTVGLVFRVNTVGFSFGSKD